MHLILAENTARPDAAAIDQMTSRSLADWPAAEREKVRTLARASSN